MGVNRPKGDISVVCVYFTFLRQDFALKCMVCGEGNGNPLQYPCRENPTDRGPWLLQSLGFQRVRYDLVTKQQHIIRLVFLSLGKCFNNQLSTVQKKAPLDLTKKYEAFVSSGSNYEI